MSKAFFSFVGVPTLFSEPNVVFLCFVVCEIRSYAKFLVLSVYDPGPSKYVYSSKLFSSNLLVNAFLGLSDDAFGSGC